MRPHTDAAPTGLPLVFLAGLVLLWVTLFLSLGSDFCVGRPWASGAFVGRALR